MNEHIAFSIPSMPATTQAADGMPRRVWTVAEVEAMVAAGIVSEDERFEMIGGEVVPKSPEKTGAAGYADILEIGAEDAVEAERPPSARLCFAQFGLKPV